MPQNSSDRGASLRLLGVLSRQRGLYEKLDILARKQSTLVGAEDPEPLLRLLSERQGVVDEMVRLDAELEPLRRDWGGALTGLSSEQRETIRRDLDAMAALASSIGNRDERDRAALADRREQIAGEIARLGVGRGAVAAYGGPKAAAPRFEDREA